MGRGAPEFGLLGSPVKAVGDDEAHTVDISRGRKITVV
jgi:hypothetical protein